MSGACVLGIDPGMKGGIALLSKEGILIEPIPIDENGMDLRELARLIADYADDTRIAYLEELNAFPGMNINGMKVLWRSIGVIHGMLVANGILTVIIRPQVWMKKMHTGIQGEDSKQKSQKAAKKYFPEVNFLASVRSKVPHEGMVEAALIAKYGYEESEL